jgi:hypothetical protein
MKLPIALLFLLCTTIVLAEVVTVQQPVNVSVQCDNATQCFLLMPGQLPFPFDGHDVNFTTTFTHGLTYDNTTGTLNITLVQNITTVNVTTTNVTIVSCNTSSITISQDVQNALITGVASNISGVCGQACSIAETERLNLKQAILDAQSTQAKVETECAANIKSIKADLESQLNISRQETDTAQTLTAPWILIAIMAILTSVTVLVIQWQKSKPQKEVPAGPGAAPIPEEFNDPEEDFPVTRGRRR